MRVLFDKAKAAKRVVGLIALALGACAPAPTRTSPVITGALVCALATGCTPALDFEIDRAFTPPETREIERAAEAWNARTNAASQIGFGPGGWYVHKVVPWGEWSALTQLGNEKIFISSSAAPEFIYPLALHEFGHALGLKHICYWPKALGMTIDSTPCRPGTPRGIMDPANPGTEFTDADLKECRRVGACD